MSTLVRATPKDVRTVYERLFDRSLSQSRLKDAVISGHFYPSASYDASNGMLPGRSILWKYLLLFNSPLATSAQHPPITQLRKLRQTYADLLKTSLRAPDGSYEDWVEIPGFDTKATSKGASIDNLTRNNPLSLDADSRWHDWFAAVDLRKIIRQDVERTFPDIAYFRNSRVQTMLTTILYLHASQYPYIGYRQGMHELLAPILYALDFDSIDILSSDELTEVCDRNWITADAHSLFEVIMGNIRDWYEWREPQPSQNAAVGQVNIKPYSAPIVTVCHEIYNDHLKTTDPALWESLQQSQIEPQIYGIRWLRLLFTREYPINEAMDLWDGLFLLDCTLQLSKWICVAMLIRIRNDLIPSDYSEQLSHLLHYPSHIPVSVSSHVSLLLLQAELLQSSPNLSTGVTVVMQNRDALAIPIKVPDSPVVPRRMNKGRRVQSSSEASGIASAQRKPSGAAAIGSRINNYADQYRRDQFSLPDLLTKGFSDINGVVSNTVTEIRRNLPDLQQRTTTPEIAFPYHTITRSHEPRPPWEPRTRFEIEREVTSMKNLSRRLGSALGWAVDALLQSGDGADIEQRKREALECLAYVRDVLNDGNVPVELDEEILVGESELKRSKVDARVARSTAQFSTTEDSRTNRPSDPNHAAAPPTSATSSPKSSPVDPPAPLPAIANTVRPRPYLSSRDSKPASGLPRSSTSTLPSVPVINARTPTYAPFTAAQEPRRVSAAPTIAPWHSTTSSFDSNSAVAALRRPPAASLNQPPPVAQQFGTGERKPSAGPPEEHTYQSDPLRG